MNNICKQYIKQVKTLFPIMGNSDGSIIWIVSNTGTFSYDGTTVKCISCSHSAKSYAQTRRIKSVTSLVKITLSLQLQ